MAVGDALFVAVSATGRGSSRSAGATQRIPNFCSAHTQTCDPLSRATERLFARSDRANRGVPIWQRGRASQGERQ